MKGFGPLELPSVLVKCAHPPEVVSEFQVFSEPLHISRVYEPQIRARLGTTAHFCHRVPIGLVKCAHPPEVVSEFQVYCRPYALC